MRDLVKHLPMLKAASSKENYPMYAQFLNVTDEYVSTCDDLSYVRVYFKMPFTGLVNLYVLETILKTLPDEYKVKQKGDKIFALAKGVDYELKTADYDFPVIEVPKEVSMMEVDEGILDVFKLALSFTGELEYESVYVDKDGLLSTTGQRLLMYHQSTSLKNPLMLSRKIIQSLQVGDKVGVGSNNNVVVDFPNGYAMHTVPMAATYPAENIREWASSMVTDLEPIISVGEFKKLIAQVNPIFFGESQRTVHIYNTDKTITVKAESPFNGEASASAKSELDDEFEILMNADFFSAVPDSYMLHAQLGQSERIVARSEVADIILAGMRI